MRAWLLSVLLVGCATTANRAPASVAEAIPVTPFEDGLGAAALGRGLSSSGPVGVDCVIGKATTRETAPRILYFLKHEIGYRRNVYAYGVAIVMNETMIDDPMMNPIWVKISFRSELAKHCGQRYVAGEQLGVMVSRELEVAAFPAGEPDLELLPSVAALEARVAKIPAGEHPGFEISYVDSPGSVIAMYNGDTTHGLMDFQSFENIFWTHPTPETTADLQKANARVGVLVRDNPYGTTAHSR